MTEPHVGPVLFGLAVLLLAAKAGGLLAERWGQPSVLGELLAGIGLGNLLPPVFGAQGIAFVRSDPTLLTLAEAGILILLFDVGLEADLRAFVRVGVSASLVAVIGVVVPLGLGWGVAAWLLPGSPTLVHVFVGATLTATSIAITVRVLKSLGATQTAEGRSSSAPRSWTTSSGSWSWPSWAAWSLRPRRGDQASPGSPSPGSWGRRWSSSASPSASVTSSRDPSSGWPLAPASPGCCSSSASPSASPWRSRPSAWGWRGS